MICDRCLGTHMMPNGPWDDVPCTACHGRSMTTTCAHCGETLYDGPFRSEQPTWHGPAEYQTTFCDVACYLADVAEQTAYDLQETT